MFPTYHNTLLESRSGGVRSSKATTSRPRTASSTSALLVSKNSRANDGFARTYSSQNPAGIMYRSMMVPKQNEKSGSEQGRGSGMSFVAVGMSARRAEERSPDPNSAVNKESTNTSVSLPPASRSSPIFRGRMLPRALGGAASRPASSGGVKARSVSDDILIYAPVNPSNVSSENNSDSGPKFASMNLAGAADVSTPNDRNSSLSVSVADAADSLPAIRVSPRALASASTLGDSITTPNGTFDSNNNSQYNGGDSWAKAKTDVLDLYGALIGTGHGLSAGPEYIAPLSIPGPDGDSWTDSRSDLSSDKPGHQVSQTGMFAMVGTSGAGSVGHAIAKSYGAFGVRPSDQSGHSNDARNGTLSPGQGTPFSSPGRWKPAGSTNLAEKSVSDAVAPRAVKPILKKPGHSSRSKKAVKFDLDCNMYSDHVPYESPEKNSSSVANPEKSGGGWPGLGFSNSSKDSAAGGSSLYAQLLLQTGSQALGGNIGNSSNAAGANGSAARLGRAPTGASTFANHRNSILLSHTF